MASSRFGIFTKRINDWISIVDFWHGPKYTFDQLISVWLVQRHLLQKKRRHLAMKKQVILSLLYEKDLTQQSYLIV